MQTLMLDGSLYPSGRSLHAALQRMLLLPPYYGMNADALNDCLAERTEPVNLWIASWGAEDTASALRPDLFSGVSVSVSSTTPARSSLLVRLVTLMRLRPEHSMRVCLVRGPLKSI